MSQSGYNLDESYNYNTLLQNQIQSNNYQDNIYDEIMDKVQNLNMYLYNMLISYNSFITILCVILILFIVYKIYKSL